MSNTIDPTVQITRPGIRSPGAAAIAGIIFSVLMVITMVLITNITAFTPADITREQLTERSGAISMALGLVPFAGIAFLWFTGVIRDHLGKHEDQFFATVFLGSGIMFLAMIFVWAATLGAVIGSYTLVDRTLVGDEILVFGFAFMNKIIGSFALRMAGVYMISTGTLWFRTKTMPRWLIAITYVVALSFLFFAGAIREARFVFPIWVALVSVYILIANRRSTRRSPVQT